VLLTDRGMALAEYGRRILGELEELQATLLADPARPSGVLRLVAFSTACRGLVGPMLGKLGRVSGGDGDSGLDIRVLAEDPREAVQRVASGEADLGVVHNWNSVPLIAPSHVATEHVCHDEADVVLSIDHPLAGRAELERADLVGEAWASTPKGAICHEALMRIFADLGTVPRVVAEDPDFASLIELGLILFAITTVVLAASKLLLSRLARREGVRT